MANFSLLNQKLVDNQVAGSLRNGIQLLKDGHLPVFFQELSKRFYSSHTSVGLRRSLDETFQNPDAKINIRIRKLKEGDFDFLMENGNLEEVDPRQVANHRSLVEAGIPYCFVAVDEDDNPCFMQWLICAESNDLIEKYFGDTFPALEQNEALLEGAYMHRKYRGLRIMPAAMARIADMAKEMNVKWVQTFVDIKNIPSLKGCKRSGFSPYLVKKDRWLFFRRSISFKPVSDEIVEKYKEATGS
ncbi:MAG: hypothetical protein WEA56_11005 [Balneolaceae bacterium]